MEPVAFSKETMCAAFQATVAERGDAVALRTKGDATRITWREYGERVRDFAGGLHALGVRAHDSVAILMVNRPEFQIADTAAMHLGATPFSIYVTSTAEQIRHLLVDSGARVAVTQTAFLPLLRAAAEGTRVETILDVDALSLPAPSGFDFDAAWRAVTPEHVLTIIYTSGTTGAPKGVELTHANMVYELRCLVTVRALEPAGRVISYLPHAHIADRTGGHYLPMMLGTTITCCPDPRALFEHVPEVRPTEFTGVPRVWEKLKAGLHAKFAAEPPERRAAIEGAIHAGLMRVRAEQAGQPVP
jgi:long-subunit acyl-CoA synthetase (AMP-forming)